jgi:hypothetical protein
VCCGRGRVCCCCSGCCCCRDSGLSLLPPLHTSPHLSTLLLPPPPCHSCRSATPGSCLLTPPDAVGDEASALSPAQLANQALLAARRAIVAYYDGRLVSDDETVAPPAAGEGGPRDVVLAPPPPDAPTGSMPAAAAAGGGRVLLSRAYGESQLYTQVSGWRGVLIAWGIGLCWLGLWGSLCAQVVLAPSVLPHPHPPSPCPASAPPTCLPCPPIAVLHRSPAGCQGSPGYPARQAAARGSPRVAVGQRRRPRRVGAQPRCWPGGQAEGQQRLSLG